MKRKLAFALGVMLLLAASLVNLNDPATASYAWAAEDVPVLTSAQEIVVGLESYAADNGNYVIHDTGYLGVGVGRFSRINTSSYGSTSIGAGLSNAGYLPSGIPDSGDRHDFLIYRCADRIGVFSQTQATTSDPTSSQWWDDNGCTDYPQRVNQNHLTLSRSVTDLDTDIVVAAQEIMAAFLAHAADNGDYVVDGTGYLGVGVGRFNRINTSSYGSTSIADGLSNAGYFPNGIPASGNRDDFLIYRCADRVGVFSQTIASETDPAASQWWSANGCTDYPLSINQTHLTLSPSLAEAVANSAPTTTAPDESTDEPAPAATAEPTAVVADAEDTQDLYTSTAVGAAGVPSVTRSGSLDYLHFDGFNDFASLGKRFSLDANAFTVEAWVNSEDLSACKVSSCRILSSATSVKERDHFWMVSTIQEDGATRLRMRVQTTTGVSTLIADTGDMQEGEWYHTAASYDGATMRLFLNGQLVGSKAKQGLVVGDDNVHTWIGGNPSSNRHRPWAGAIDDVRIWDYARDASTVTASMHQDLDGSQAGLVAQYKFELPEVTRDSVGDQHAVLGWLSTTANDPIPTQRLNSIGVNPGDPTPAPTTPPVVTPEPTTPPVATPVPTTPPVATPVPTTAPVTEPDPTPEPTPEPQPALGALVSTTGFLRFDGVDDFVNLNTLDVNGTGITLEGWFNSEDLGNCRSDDCRIISKASGTAGEDHVWMLSTVEANGAIRLRFRAQINGNTETLIASSGDLAAGNWYHAAATYDGATMRIFLNGSEVGTLDVFGALDTDPSVSVWVGGNPSAETDRPWKGSIDDVRIWDTARTPGEILDTIDNELTGTESGLVAYYPFNQAQPSVDLTNNHPAGFGSEQSQDSNDPTVLSGHANAPGPEAFPDPDPDPDPDPYTDPDPDPEPDPSTPEPGPVPDPIEYGDGELCSFTNPNEPTDDPNPDYDGSLGRFRVSTSPIPAGYPTPQTTGLCGVGLTPDDLIVSPGLTIKEDGAVYDGYDFTGSVKIEADNVTIRNSRITSTGHFPLHFRPGYTGLLVEDTRIRGNGDGVSNAVYAQGSFATFRRVHVSGGSDGFKPTSAGNFLLEDSYYAGNYRRQGTSGSGSGSHNDVVQIRSGNNFTIRNNTLIGPWQMSTSVFIIQAKGGDIDNVLVEGNYLSGGGFTIYTTETSPYDLTNTTVRNNRIEEDSWQHGAIRNSGGATYTNNTIIPS